MKKRVEELLAGRLKNSGSILRFSTDSISVSVAEGSIYSDSFTVFTDDGSEVRSYVFSDSSRIKVNRERFAGKSVRIFVEVNTTGLKSNEAVEGNIIFLTHIGQYTMPVFVMIDEPSLPEAYGGISNLDDFAVLAENDFREAFRMFKGEYFHYLLKDHDASTSTLYRGLSKNPVTYQHLEEFLIAAGKKEKIEISAEKLIYSFYISEDQKEHILIKKNTWGHIDINVSTRGDFFVVSRDHLTEDDFLGNTLYLEIIILKDRVASRTKKGRVILSTPYQTFEIAVEASSTVDEITPFVYRQTQISNLIKMYIRLKQKRMNYRTWYDTSREIVEEMKEEDEGGFALFAEMFLCYSKEDNRALIELLWKVKSGKIKFNAPWERAAYLYFAKNSGLLPVEERNISSRLARCYREEPSDYIPLAFYLKDSENDNPARTLETMEKAYDSGCNSPLMYIDAWNIIKRRETLLRRVTPFVLHMLYYVQRNGMMIESVLMRAAFLIDGGTDFDRQTFEFLQKGYEDYPGKELLEVICRYIMNGNPNRPEYHKWFREAVQSDIRMTRLYEYYMETRPEDDRSDLPLPVKIYFSYSPALGESRRAYLYSLIVENKDKDPVTFENYNDTMHIFALNALKAGRINENYAVLYSEYFTGSEDKAVLNALAEIIFAHRIACDHPDIRAAAVCHAQAEGEEVRRMIDDKAYPCIYTPDSCVLLEDSLRRRFSGSIPFSDTAIFNARKIAEQCFNAGISTPGLHMYFCFDPEAKKELNGHTLLMYWSAAEDPEISREYRDALRAELLAFFMNTPRKEAVAPFVQKMKGLTYAQINKTDTIRLFIRFERYEDAYEIVRNFGCENIPEDLLAELITRIILDRDFEEDQDLILEALYVYRTGNAGGVILDYLCRYVIVDPDEMDDIRQDACAAEIDTYEIEERMLLFMLFIMRNTAHAKEIFDHYRNNGGRDVLCRAYISYLGLVEAENRTEGNENA